jgi:DNA-binding transcriptional LysR family regulator
MNSEWLGYFVAIAETRNLQAAADRLHVTPQAVSKAIAGLESQFKQRLVDRDRRIKGLTPAGEALLEEARMILASLENAERRLEEVRRGKVEGPVKIAGDGLWHHYLLPPLLKALATEYPEIRPQLHEMLADDAERWVASGDIDIGLLLRAPRRTDLEWVEGVRTPYVIAGAPQPKKDWSELGYIVPRFFQKEEENSLDGWPETKFKRRIVAEVELLETAIHLCEAGLGAAFLPEMALRDRFERGSLAVVADAPAEFADQLYVVWRKGVRPTPAAREMLKALNAV